LLAVCHAVSSQGIRLIYQTRQGVKEMRLRGEFSRVENSFGAAEATDIAGIVRVLSQLRLFSRTRQ
jgi:hypothetical protein